MTRASRLAALAVVAASFGVAAPAAADQPEPQASEANRLAAQDAHRHALELFDRGQHAEALAEFKRAYALAPSFRILYNIGLSDVALGDSLSALDAFASYLREGGDRIPASRRTQVEAEIARLSKLLASLNIEVEEPAAEVTVDGTLLGPGPISQQLRLSSGRHTVGVRSADGTVKTQSVTLTAGGEQSLRFQAPSATATASPLAPGVSPPAETTSGRHREFPWIAWGVTGALGASAAVTGVLALNAHADERDAKTRQGITLDALQAAHDKVQNFALATDILLVGTALSAGVSVYLTFRPTHSAEASQTSLLLSPGQIGLRHDF